MQLAIGGRISNIGEVFVPAGQCVLRLEDEGDLGRESVMAILTGAVAYREDRITSYLDEIQTWTEKEVFGRSIGCPKGCNATYRLIVEADASVEQVKIYITAICKQFERTACSDHPHRIRINRPQPISQ